jgi:hypothetical protein
MVIIDSEFHMISSSSTYFGAVNPVGWEGLPDWALSFDFIRIRDRFYWVRHIIGLQTRHDPHITGDIPHTFLVPQLYGNTMGTEWNV